MQQHVGHVGLFQPVLLACQQQSDSLPRGFFFYFTPGEKIEPR